MMDEKRFKINKESIDQLFPKTDPTLDYLTSTGYKSPVTTFVEHIITNPPFCLAQEFITKSAEKKKPFALLLKSQYWHSAKRRKIFSECQPTFVLPLTWRPDFEGKGASMLDMIWCVWIGRSQITYYMPLEKPKLCENSEENKENGT